MKYFLALLNLIFLSSCNQKIDSTLHDISSEISLVNTISNSNRIIIKSRKKDCADSNRKDDCFENSLVYVAKNDNQIKMFEKLFDNLSVTDYRCCPEKNFKINFFNGSRNTETYFADSVSIKDSVRVFEKHYRFSYIIEKKKWNDFLNAVEH